MASLVAGGGGGGSHTLSKTEVLACFNEVVEHARGILGRSLTTEEVDRIVDQAMPETLDLTSFEGELASDFLHEIKNIILRGVGRAWSRERQENFFQEFLGIYFDSEDEDKDISTETAGRQRTLRFDLWPAELKEALKVHWETYSPYNEENPVKRVGNNEYRTDQKGIDYNLNICASEFYRTHIDAETDAGVRIFARGKPFHHRSLRAIALRHRGKWSNVPPEPVKRTPMKQPVAGGGVA
jgi:hypothetical protein